MGVSGHETREIYVGNVGYLEEQINMSDLSSGARMRDARTFWMSI